MRKIILKATIIFSVFVLMFTQSVSGYQVNLPSNGFTASDSLKLSYNLRSIVSKDSGYDVALSSLKSNEQVISKTLLGLPTGDNSYHIYVYFNENFTQADLERFGKVEYFSTEYKLADLWLNATQIAALSTEPNVLNIMEVTPAIFMAGTFLTEGYLDTNHAVASYLGAGNLAGDGLKIGIISDGTDSVATAISTGDVPSDVVILNNRYGGDEGTAMLEIVHDMAPNATLYFSDYGNSMLGFNDSIKALVDAGCDIIVDDIVYLAEPYFEDGVISQFIESYVTPRGILYLSSAGNQADNHYQGNYTSTNTGTGTYDQDFNTSITGIQHMPILIPAYANINITLQWSDPYTSSSHDLDLEICADDAMSSSCIYSQNYQLGNGYVPYEQINASNPYSYAITYYVGVYGYESLSNLKIEIYTFGAKPTAYGTRSDSTFGHSTSKDVLSIAAISQQSNGVTRPFSSLGPFTMRDGTVRNKPDFTGVDQVTVSGVNFYSPFSGTSAAAPHIAAVAALLWSNNRPLTRVELIGVMKTMSVDLMTTGYDYNSGFGFVTLSQNKLAYLVTKNTSVSGVVIMDRLVNVSVSNTSTATVSSVGYTVTSDFGVTRYRYTFYLNGINSGTTNLIFTDMSNTQIYRRSIIVGVPITDLILSQSSYVLSPHETVVIQSSFLPTDATQQTLTYLIADTSIATVNATGTITGVSVGTTKVTVTTLDGRFSKEASITVRVPLLSISINEADFSMSSRTATTQLSVSFNPTDATDQSFTWTSSNLAVATVNSSGVVTAKTNGIANIIATATNGQSDAVTVTVKDLVDSITLSSTSVTIGGLNRNVQLSASISPSSALLKTLNWQSLEPSVVTVDQNGLVHSVGYGSTTITVTSQDGAIQRTISVLVRKTFVSSITLTKSFAQFLALGQTAQINATVVPNDATDTTILYESANTAVATVTASGLVTSAGYGTTTIRVYSQDGGYSTLFNVYVLNSDLIQLNCDPISKLGSKIQCSLTGLAENVTFTLTSEDPSAIGVEGTKLLLKELGSVSIKATLDSFDVFTAVTVYPNYLENLIMSRDVYGTYRITWDNVDFTNSRASYQITRCRLNTATWACINDGDYKSIGLTNVTSFSDGSDPAKDYLYTISATYTTSTGSFTLKSEMIWQSRALRFDHTLRKVYVSTAYSLFDLSKILNGGLYDASFNPITSFDAAIKNNLTLGLHFDMTGLVYTAYQNPSTMQFPVYYDIILIPQLQTPTNLRFEVLSSTGLKLSWNTVPYAESYDIYRSTGGTDPFALIDSTTSTTYQDLDLTFNQTYSYQIKAKATVEGTDYVSSASAPGSSKTVLSAVTSINSESSGYDRNIISWSVVANASGYEIYRSIGTSTTYALVGSTSSLYYVNTGLLTNTQYNYKVRPYSTLGTTRVYGLFSNVVFSKPQVSAPTVTVTSSGYTSLKITWPAIDGANGYEVSYSTSETGTYTKLALLTTTSASLSTLIPNKNYYVKVRAYRTVNYVKIYGALSKTVSATPIPSTPVGSAVSLSFNSLKISWSAVLGASGYEVYKLNGSTSQYDFTLDTPLSTFTDSLLVTGAESTYKVKAYHLIGTTRVYSAESAAITAKAVPSEVTGLKTSLPKYSELTVSWTAVTGATGYEVSRALTSTGVYTVLGNVEGGLAYADSGLAFNTAIYYKVRPYTTVNDVKVYGAYSAVVSGKSALEAVTGQTAAYSAYNANLIGWNAVIGATGY
jgi:uncharacterized protein YjdB/fibronectin type 3 domain-containing protein